MLVVLSDSHRHTDTGLEGRTLDAVREADVVAHAGDFTTEATLDAFREIAPRLHAVYGNRDDPSVCERLPEALSFAYADVDVAMTHPAAGRSMAAAGGPTALELFGRERGADLVVSGHSHRPEYTQTETLGLLNPGSHADPRGYRPGHAELEAADDGLDGRLVSLDGTVAETFHVPASDD